MAAHLRLVETDTTTVPVACNTCGHLTEAVAHIVGQPDGSAFAVLKDAQLEIRDNHCKGNKS